MSDRFEELRALSPGYEPSDGALENCTKLDLGSKNLSLVPQSVFELSFLAELWIWGNDQLSSLPPEISRLTGLKALGAPYNQLLSLPEEIAYLTALETIDVSNNQLSSLPSGVSGLVSLVTFCMTNNHLSSLPAEVSGLVSLTGLRVNSNKLSSLPSGISGLTNLQSLDASDNQLSVLPAEISHLASLSTLEIYDNSIQELPSQITMLTSLRSLQIENCGNVFIKRAPLGISNLPCWNVGADKEHIRAMQFFDSVSSNVTDLSNTLATTEIADGTETA